MREKCPYAELFWSVFSPNAGKYGPEQLQIGALFAPCEVSLFWLICPTCYIRSRLPITYKKLFFKSMQNSQENTCAEVSFEQSCRPTVCNFIKKETLAQIFPCVIFEIFQISFFAEYPRETPITNTNHGHNLGKRNSKDSQAKVSKVLWGLRPEASCL